MSEKIHRVTHRHSDQKAGDPDLVLEVGKTIPAFYQEGRKRGLTVQSFRAGDPIVCKLSDGDEIYIGNRNVGAIETSTSKTD